jgi:hypothetical protein
MRVSSPWTLSASWMLVIRRPSGQWGRVPGLSVHKVLVRHASDLIRGHFGS